MRVYVYQPMHGWSSNPRGKAVINAMTAGARYLGHSVQEIIQSYNSPIGDVGIIWGITSYRFQNETMFRTPIIKKCPKIIVVERGFVNREEYHSAGLGWIGGRADHRNDASPPDRWDKLGVKLAPKVNRVGPQLVCGQVPHDTSCQHVDHIQWIQNKVLQLNDPIIRPHPLAKNINVTGKISNLPLKLDLARAESVHTFSSTVGVDSMIAGIPTFADDENSMVWNCGDREQWAYNLAYAQWTLEEMRKGLPILHLLK
jgi:hypothetical protein